MKKKAQILIIIGSLMIITGIVIEIADFYNDYKCSTTTDIKWFFKNKCERYLK